jgi:hypothetical protein
VVSFSLDKIQIWLWFSKTTRKCNLERRKANSIIIWFEFWEPMNYLNFTIKIQDFLKLNLHKINRFPFDWIQPTLTKTWKPAHYLHIYQLSLEFLIWIFQICKSSNVTTITYLTLTSNVLDNNLFFRLSFFGDCFFRQPVYLAHYYTAL